MDCVNEQTNSCETVKQIFNIERSLFPPPMCQQASSRCLIHLALPFTSASRLHGTCHVRAAKHGERRWQPGVPLMAQDEFRNAHSANSHCCSTSAARAATVNNVFALAMTGRLCSHLAFEGPNETVHDNMPRETQVQMDAMLLTRVLNLRTAASSRNYCKSDSSILTFVKSKLRNQFRATSTVAFWIGIFNLLLP